MKKIFPSTNETEKGLLYRIPFSYCHGILEDMSGTDIILTDDTDPHSFNVGIEPVIFVSNIDFKGLIFTKFDHKMKRKVSLVVAIMDFEAMLYAYEWYTK